MAVVGVFSGLGPKYAERRAVLRETWFPGTAERMEQLRAATSVDMRFVVARVEDPGEEASLAAEEALCGSFFRPKSVLERYENLALKVLAFWRLALQELQFRYILKVDDDVYFRPALLPRAVERWKGAEYVGCFRRRGRVRLSPRHTFFETGHQLLGTTYFTYATGSTYAVRSDAAALISEMPPGALRFFGCGDDCSVAMWLVAFNASVLEDGALCRWECDPDTVTVRHHGRCPGLCNPLEDIHRLHVDPRCDASTPTFVESASEGKGGRIKSRRDDMPLWVPPCIITNSERTDTMRLESCGW